MNRTIGTDYILREGAIRADIGYVDDKNKESCSNYVKCCQIEKKISDYYKKPSRFLELTKKEVKRKGCKTYDGFIGALKSRLDRISSTKRIEKIHDLVFNQEYTLAIREIFR